MNCTWTETDVIWCLCTEARSGFLALRSHDIGLGGHGTLQGLPQVSQRRLWRSEPSSAAASAPVSVPAASAAAAWKRRPDDAASRQLQRAGQIRCGVTAGQRLLWNNTGGHRYLSLLVDVDDTCHSNSEGNIVIFTPLHLFDRSRCFLLFRLRL